MISLDFQKDLSYIGWEEVRNRQLLRFPLDKEWIRLTGMQEGDTIVDIGSGTKVFVCEYSKIVGKNERAQILVAAARRNPFKESAFPSHLISMQLLI